LENFGGKLCPAHQVANSLEIAGANGSPHKAGQMPGKLDWAITMLILTRNYTL
jgi:hypothetical protein